MAVKKMKKKLYHNLALQVGGSHYPDVGGELLEKFGDMLVNEIIKTIEENGLQDMVHTTYQKDYARGVKERLIKSIKEKVNEDLQ